MPLVASMLITKTQSEPSRHIFPSRKKILSLIGNFVESIDYSTFKIWGSSNLTDDSAIKSYFYLYRSLEQTGFCELRRLLKIKFEEETIQMSDVRSLLVSSMFYKKELSLFKRIIFRRMNEQLQYCLWLLLTQTATILEEFVKHKTKRSFSTKLYSFTNLFCSLIKSLRESPLLPSLANLSYSIAFQVLNTENKLCISVLRKAVSEIRKKSKELQKKQIYTFEFALIKDNKKQIETQSDDSWREREIEHCEGASTASASSRSSEIREDLSTLSNHTSSLEDLIEDLIVARTGVEGVQVLQSLPAKSSVEEVTTYYDGFEIDDLVISFDEHDHMLCQAKGPMQEKKTKNKFVCNGKRINTSYNSQCSSPAYIKGSTTQHFNTIHITQARLHGNTSSSAFMTSTQPLSKRNFQDFDIKRIITVKETIPSNKYRREKWA